MPRDEYFSFIYPYLDQAKRELHVPKYLAGQAKSLDDSDRINLFQFITEL